MKTEIKEIYASEIIDSRGMPTVMVKTKLKGEFLGTASVPSGASTGKYEAHEKRDGDKNRLVEATWEAGDGHTHSVDLAVTSADRSGLLVDLTLALNDMKVPVNALTAKVLKDGTGLIQLNIDVTGQDQLAKVLMRLNNVKSVISAKRI